MPEPSNVLQWFCEDGTKVSVRPSGTEPKIKFYIEVKADMSNADQYEELDRKGAEQIERIKKKFRSVILLHLALICSDKKRNFWG